MKEERKKEEEKRIEAQAERIVKQKLEEEKRVESARQRGEAVTGLDLLEIKKLAKQTAWSKKWDRRAEKFDGRFKSK